MDYLPARLHLRRPVELRHLLRIALLDRFFALGGERSVIHPFRPPPLLKLPVHFLGHICQAAFTSNAAKSA